MNKNISLILILVTVGVAIFLAYATAQQAVRYQAIDGCVKAGYAKFKNAEGTDVQVPDEFSYNLCMEKKGLK